MFRRFVSESFVIQDYVISNTLSSDDGHITFDSGTSYSYSSDGLSYSSSSDKHNYLNANVPTDVEMTCKIKFNSSMCFPLIHDYVGYKSSNEFSIEYIHDANAWATRKTSQHSVTTGVWHDLKVIHQNDTVSYYVDDVLFDNRTETHIDNMLDFWCNRNTVWIKDLKIKPL